MRTSALLSALSGVLFTSGTLAYDDGQWKSEWGHGPAQVPSSTTSTDWNASTGGYGSNSGYGDGNGDEGGDDGNSWESTTMYDNWGSPTQSSSDSGYGPESTTTEAWGFPTTTGGYGINPESVIPSTTVDVSLGISLPTSTGGASPYGNGTGNGTMPGDFSSLRGVNIGAWLVLEEWMLTGTDSNPFSGTGTHDEFSLCQQLGEDKCTEVLEKHWGSDWFNEDVVKKLADSGVNALRIPIGFWAFDNENTPYVKGSADWMDKAIGWARNHNMKVWVDLHGAPGSQNGFDNSGHAGDVEWQTGDNIDRTISVLKTIAKKYGSTEYADVVAAIELINEPISWGANKIETTKQFARDAYKAVRENSSNEKLMIVMHDAFVGAETWQSLPSDVGAGDASSGLLGLDLHRYQVFTDEDKTLTQDEHVKKACGWADEIKTSEKYMKTYVGEWSGATVINSNGSAGSEQNGNWDLAMTGQVRRFMEAQLDAFEYAGSGYFFWAFKGPGAWSWLDGVEKGWIPQPLDDRKNPNQCGFESKRSAVPLGERRVKRNQLGRVRPKNW